MKVKLILVLTILFVLSGYSVGYASENITSDASENVITLEQAKELASKNSRNLKKYGINKEKAKYQLYQIEELYEDADDEYDYLIYKINKLSQEYSGLRAKLDEGDTSVVSRMNEIQEEMDSLWEKIDEQVGTVESLSDKKTEAENQYNDAVVYEENFKKQLDYLVEEFYTIILEQEKNLSSLNKEYEIKQLLLDLEKARLGLGRSTQFEVDQLSIDLATVSKKIEELQNSIKASKGKLNDIMGRDYDAELIVVPFEVPDTIEVPEDDILLSRASQEYDRIYELKRDIEQKKGDLDDVEEDSYQDELLELEIEELKLQLEDERYKLVETVKNLVADIKTKQKNYQLSLVNYENAKKNYEWDKKRFEIGQISRLDLLQSELNWLNSESEKTAAEHDLFLAKRSLKLAEDGILL